MCIHVSWYIDNESRIFYLFLQPVPCIFLAKTAERVRTAIALAHLALEGLNVKNVRFLQYYLFLLYIILLGYMYTLFINSVYFSIDVGDWVVVQEAKTLEESITHCQGLGREMVSILSEEDADHFATITSDIDTSGSEHGYIRIGLQAPNADCQWSWVGTTASFDPGDWFWHSAEPNGCNGNELCAQTGRGGKKWNDSKCYYKTYFVCGKLKPGNIISQL